MKKLTIVLVLCCTTVLCWGNKKELIDKLTPVERQFYLTGLGNGFWWGRVWTKDSKDPLFCSPLDTTLSPNILEAAYELGLQEVPSDLADQYGGVVLAGLGIMFPCD